ncbi:MAG TPA: hypothetical protein DD733_12820 [Clostridiales bacterium]|nr:hypothetical protein [Clostridiales bacterium]
MLANTCKEMHTVSIFIIAAAGCKTCTANHMHIANGFSFDRQLPVRPTLDAQIFTLLYAFYTQII